MGEEAKQEETKQEKSKASSIIIKYLFAFILLALAMYLLFGRGWWLYTWQLMKASAGPFLLLASIITFAIAKE